MASFLLIACERGGGAWPPVAALCRELVQERHKVRVLCDEPIAYAFAGVEILTVPTDVQSTPFIDNVLATELIPKAERGESLDSVGSPLEDWAESVAPLVAPSVAASTPDVVVGSMFGLPLGIRLARQLEIPVVAINPGAYVGPNPPRALREDYAGLNLWFFERCVLPPLLRADMVLHATDREFDLGFTGLPSNHHYIGPLIWDAPGRAPAAMTEGGSAWITASVSMANQPDEMDLLKTILASARGIPARLLLTAPDHNHTELQPVPTNVTLASFVPHGEALQHSKLMLSHAGHGAVMRALWMGVPMVLTPWDRDQPAVAFRAAQLGVARVIERAELTADRLRGELVAALEDAVLRANAVRHSERLQLTNPPSVAVKLLAQMA